MKIVKVPFSATQHDSGEEESIKPESLSTLKLCSLQTNTLCMIKLDGGKTELWYYMPESA